MIRSLAALLVAAVLATAAAAPAAAAEEVNLYSYRQPFLMKPLIDAFTEKTGIKVNVVYAKKGMLERLKAEGANSPADAVLTVDIGRLHDMAEAGVLQPIKSAALERNVPARFRHPDGLWFGLSLRGRVLYVSRDRVAPGTVASYEDLVDPSLKGRICMRSGKHVYNVSLLASVIAHRGVDGARAWLDGVKANLARKPQGNDRAQAKAIHQGVCDVALGNTYYMGKMTTLSSVSGPRPSSWCSPTSPTAAPTSTSAAGPSPSRPRTGPTPSSCWSSSPATSPSAFTPRRTSNTQSSPALP